MKSKILLHFLLVFSFSFLFSAFIHAATFEVDTAHTSVNFKIRHLLTKVQGRFTGFKGSFEIDDKTGNLKSIEATVDPATIDTNNKKRDDHLRSPDFFDVVKFPTATFVSGKLDLAKGNSVKIPGMLTIHGVTKDVSFDAEFLGKTKDPWGAEKSALSMSLRINRKDFGIVWNKVVDATSVLLGDDVDLEIEVEGNAKVVEAPKKQK